MPGFYCACDAGTRMSHDKTACLRSSQGGGGGEATAKAKAGQRAVSLAVARGQ